MPALLQNGHPASKRVEFRRHFIRCHSSLLTPLALRLVWCEPRRFNGPGTRIFEPMNLWVAPLSKWGHPVGRLGRRPLSRKPRRIDVAEPIFTLGMLALVLGIGAVLIVQRWRGAGSLDRAVLSDRQTTSELRWRVALVTVLITGWACTAIALIDRALRPGTAASLPSTMGSMPLPAWLALATHSGLQHPGFWYVLWATGTWLALMLERPKGPPQSSRLSYGFVACLALVSIAANIASIWH